MVKTLRPIGNSLGLIIDRPILDLLGIDRTTPLDLRLEDGRLTIVPLPKGEASATEAGDRP